MLCQATHIGLFLMHKYLYSELAKAIFQQLDNKNPIYIKAYGKAVEFFTVYDEIEGTDHSRLFQHYFGEGRNRRKSVDGLAFEHFLSGRTLYRYTVKYVSCFCFYLRLDGVYDSDDDLFV